jgi:hypothetical protein
MTEIHPHRTREYSFSCEFVVDEENANTVAELLDCSAWYEMDGEFVGFGPKITFSKDE